MGVSFNSKIVVGISLAELFTKIEEIDSSYDEHDKRGNKTGRRIEEYVMQGTLPDGRICDLAKGKRKCGDIVWEYNFFESLFFDGDCYVGDLKTNLGLYYPYYEADSLEQRIVGIEIPAVGGVGGYVREFEIETINEIKLKCAKQLHEMYMYSGEVKNYLINYYS